ncbi:hypothetical protein TNCV_2009621 [Trichonephila clavipes]|nr:hypothetical protein TNCV_2009621 [Trichonephila clavipes]
MESQTCYMTSNIGEIHYVSGGLMVWAGIPYDDPYTPMSFKRPVTAVRPQPRKAYLERFREQLQLSSENNTWPENNIVERVGLIVTAN